MRTVDGRWAVVAACLAVGACASESRFDRYGGYAGIESEATGHFRVEKIDGRWMFITPEGHGYVALGGNHVGKFLDDPEQPEPLSARLDGDRQAAEDALYEAMVEMGLNAGEAYAPLLPSLTKRLPYVVNVDYPDREKLRFDIFDPAYRERLDAQVTAECRKVADDPMVLGIAFADLPVWNSRRVDFFRGLPAEAPGKRKYVEHLESRYDGVAALNEAYGTAFGSFAEVVDVDHDNEAVRSDDEAFLGLVAEALYARLEKLVREAAPNKLFFGERYVLRMVPEPVLRVIGRHVDVFCTQALILSPQRPPEWQVFQRDGYDQDHAATGDKPMIIIDWAAPFSLDETYETERGTVKNEAEASREAAEWLEGVFELPYVIGVFKCQLIGAHGNDRWFPEGRMKRTYLRDDGLPFAFRTPTAKQAHERVLAKVYGM